ncbi:MAG: hypothetical protein WC551_06445 [Patescibacteria group bacterium]
MKLSKDKIIFWTPRILSILFLLFLAMFSLDIFDMNLDFWGTLVGLFMHNIPVFVLAIVLAIAWKHEIVGAIFYTLAGLAYIATLVVGMKGDFQPYMISWSLTIAGPAFLIAWLFFVGWRKKRRTGGNRA